MGLQDVDGLDGVGVTPLAVVHLDGVGGIDDHPGEEFRIGTDQLGGHGGFGCVDQAFFSQFVHGISQMFL